MHLYVEGHRAKHGYAISRAWSDAECAKLDGATAAELAPLRFVSTIRRAIALVKRYNQRFATHE